MEQLSDEERSTLLTQLSELKLLANAAEERGLDDERTIATELELQRIQAMARFMALRYLEEHPATEYELRTVYEANLARLAGTQYKARHILLRTEDEAQDVIQALNAGSDFAELARQRSTGPTGPNGGDLGWFSAESMVRPFAEAVATMSPGNYSASPVQTRFGWHVILLEDRREQQEPGLDAVRAEITNLVNQQKIESYVQELSHSQQ